MVKHHVDVRVTPRSMTSLIQMLDDAGIPHDVIIDDLHKFIFISFLPHVSVQNAAYVVAVLSISLVTFLSRLSLELL